MVKIFAKKGTCEKALVVCSQEQVGEIIIMLNESHGGNWLYVDKLIPQKGDYLLFKDSLEYRGYEVDRERYSDAIVSHIDG